jgi:hypothetical protein
MAWDTPLNAAYIGASNGDRPEFTGRDDPHIAG